MGRAMAKLTKIETEDGQQVPAILLEPIYTTSETTPIYRAIIQLALKKAEAVGAVLVLGREVVVATGADNSKAVSLLPKEGASLGFAFNKQNTRVYLQPSNNPYEYSDTLGGSIGLFRDYRELEDAVVLSK